MVPYPMMEMLVRERETERHRNLRPGLPKRDKGVRERLGWALVHLGLRLAMTRRAVPVTEHGFAC